MDIYLFYNTTIEYKTELTIMISGTSKNQWSICDRKNTYLEVENDL
jgi:hypothetical protein